MTGNTAPILRAELEKWKGVSHSVVYGSRHPKLVLRYGEATRYVTFSTTKVEGRGLRNKVSDLRKTLRELGAQRG